MNEKTNTRNAQMKQQMLADAKSAFAHVVVMMDQGLETTPAEEIPAEGVGRFVSKARHGKAGLGKAGQGKARHGEAWLRKVRMTNERKTA